MVDQTLECRDCFHGTETVQRRFADVVALSDRKVTMAAARSEASRLLSVHRFFGRIDAHTAIFTLV